MSHWRLSFGCFGFASSASCVGPNQSPTSRDKEIPDGDNPLNAINVTTPGDVDCVADNARHDVDINGLSTLESAPYELMTTASSFHVLESCEQARDAALAVMYRPQQLLVGLQFSSRILGRGSYGIVVQGSFAGAAVAIKVTVANVLNKSALRELLLAPRLAHQNIVKSYTTRCMRLTSSLLKGVDPLEGLTVGPPGNTAGECSEAAAADDEFSMPPPTRSQQPTGGEGGPSGGETSTSAEPDAEAVEQVARVLHPYLYSLQAQPGHILILVVQELCRVGTLGTAISRGCFQPDPGRRWSARTAVRSLVRTALESATGLAYMHELNLVHGDLKPANILLQQCEDDRRGYTPKLADFGVTHLLSRSATSLTSETWGSAAYMAPEAFKSRVSRSTDVWAFGVVLWEMVTSKKPYRAVPESQVMFGVSHGTLELEWPVVPLVVVAAEVKIRLVDLGKRCLSFKAADRPSIRDITSELELMELILKGKEPPVAACAVDVETPT